MITMSLLLLLLRSQMWRGLEREDRLNEDCPITRRWRSEGTGGQRLRFAEKRRGQSTVGLPRFDVVEDVNPPADQRQAVLAGHRGIELRLRLAPTQSASIYAAV